MARQQKEKFVTWSLKILEPKKFQRDDKSPYYLDITNDENADADPSEQLATYYQKYTPTTM
jgi:hypothetical protein